jgi:hypothetical protein
MTESSGSETRQRQPRHTVRFTELENALLLAKANAAGVPPATFLRCVALGFPFPRQARRPTTNEQDVGRILIALGKAATAFERVAPLVDPEAVEITRNDIAEMRLLCFNALGRKP